MSVSLIVVLALLLALAMRVVVCLLQAPHFVIGKPGDAYMNRWYVLPKL